MKLLKHRAGIWNFRKFQYFHYLHKLLNIQVLDPPEHREELKNKQSIFKASATPIFYI